LQIRSRVDSVPPLFVRRLHELADRDA